MKALPVDPDAGEILMPGERGDREYRRREREGRVLPKPVLEDLQKLALRFGVGMPA